MQNTISKSEILKNLTHDVTVYCFDEIDSTNNYAKKLKDNCALVVSSRQSGGRGRLGRSFHSPSGGIYMSVLTPVSDLYQNVPFITTAASVAVVKAIKSLYNKDVSIKWVNDIYLSGKKVAGILCESSDSSHAVIGIGINFCQTSFPEELKDTAASLFDKSEDNDANILISLITDNLLEITDKFPDTSFMEYYKQNSAVLGKDILCIKNGKSFLAKAVDIDSFGALIIETPCGIQVLNSGEITVRIMN